MKSVCLLCAALLFASRAFAQAADPVLDAAFPQLKGNGPVPFSRAVYEGDTDNARQLAAQFNPLLAQSGSFVGYEVVSRKFLTKRVERISLAIYFENFPVYLRIDAYESPKGRIYLSANVSREASGILPFDLISATGK